MYKERQDYMKRILKYKKSLNGQFIVSGDKSMTHRAIMLASISNGITTINAYLKGADCISTINCFKSLGIHIEENKETITVYGRGLYGLSSPNGTLFVGNSGTTIRLICGILTAQPFNTHITGDKSIISRPMDRIITPLSKMGGNIQSNDGLAPLFITGNPLYGTEYTLPIASAQVKSAILFASLYAKSPTKIIEPKKTRNHSEIMLNHFGANVTRCGNVISSQPIKELTPTNIYICGDLSSACFFIVGALITKNSYITIKNVGVNPTRTGFLDVLINMGASIYLHNERYINGEKICDITAKSSMLKGLDIYGDVIPRMIDELPLFALVATLAKGRSTVKNAEELKFKESNRIESISTELNKIGANITQTDDGMIINGNKILIGCECKTYNDHRIAMCLAIASLVCFEPISLDNTECISVSFPNFFDILDNL